MKRFLSLILLLSIVLALPLFGCGTRFKAPWDSGFSLEIDEFNEKIAEGVEDEGVSYTDFYVLAPQDYRTEKSFEPIFDCMGQYRKEKNGGFENMSGIYESFFVCNEEKYGEQITDWGQYGGVPINFKISIAIDHKFSVKSDLNLAFEYKDNSDYENGTYCINSNKILHVWVKSGEVTFAWAIVECYSVYEQEQAKQIVEGYLKENLIPKDEYLRRFEAGEIKPSQVVATEKNAPNDFVWYIPSYRYSGKVQLYRRAGMTQNEISQYFDEVKKYAKEGKSYLVLNHIDNEYGNDDYEIYATDVTEQGETTEEFLHERIGLFCFELGGSPRERVLSNFDIEITLVPVEVEEIDVQKISFEYTINKKMEKWFNIYYDGNCFASGLYRFADYYITEKSESELKTYFETYVKENLVLVKA